MDFPIKNGDFPVRYVKLPEGSGSFRELSTNVPSRRWSKMPTDQPICGSSWEIEKMIVKTLYNWYPNMVHLQIVLFMDLHPQSLAFFIHSSWLFDPSSCWVPVGLPQAPALHPRGSWSCYCSCHAPATRRWSLATATSRSWILRHTYCLLVLNVGNGWEWGLLGWLLLVIVDHSLPTKHQ